MKTRLLQTWAGKTFAAIVFSLFLLPGTAGSQTWANVEVKGRYVFDQLNISPNPFAEKLYLSYTLLKDSEVDIAVYNGVGQRVFLYNTTAVTQYAGPHQITLSLDNGIPSGMYFVRLTAVGTGTITKRVVAR